MNEIIKDKELVSGIKKSLSDINKGNYKIVE